MKINKKLWFEILSFFKNDFGLSKNIFEFVKISKLEYFNFLESENPYDDNLRDFAEKLSQLDLEDNSRLKELLFKKFNEIPYLDKTDFFKGENHNLADINLFKKYFIKNILNYPSIHEMYRFRKNLNIETIQNGLQTIFNNTHFYKSNQIKQDYWDNHLKSKDIDKLLILVEMAKFKIDDVKNWNKIGIFNDVKQAKLDILLSNLKRIPLITSKEFNAFIVNVSFSTTAILEYDKQLGVKIINNFQMYVRSLFDNSLGLGTIHNEKEEYQVKNWNYITYDKESFNSSIKKRDIIISWLDNNVNFLIELIKKDNDKKNANEINNEMKKLSDKILFKNSLETNLTENNSLKLKSKL